MINIYLAFNICGNRIYLYNMIYQETVLFLYSMWLFFLAEVPDMYLVAPLPRKTRQEETVN